MSINQEYKNFACVEKLEEYKEKFIEIAEQYGSELNDKIIIDGSVYTLHDFNSHCMGIYKIISEVLLEPTRAYVTGGLTEKELYILDLAVLFHDISMSRDIMTERSNHSKKSAEHVQKLYDNKESTLYKKSGLTLNEIKALKSIITAHSDVKDGTVPPEKRGLNDSNLSDKMPARSGFIRAKLLAGILRLADELDITNERLGSTNIEENLKSAKGKCAELEIQIKSGEERNLKEQYGKYMSYVESLTHWENLHLFSQVFRETQDDTIYLVADEDYLQQLIDEGDTASALARRILKVYEKVEDEWHKIRQAVVENSFQKLDIKSFFPVSTIRVRCNNVNVQQELDKQINHIKRVKASVETEVSCDESKKLEQDKGQEILGVGVQLIDPKLAEKLAHEVKRRHLLKVGHFRVDDIFCARDWIDIKEIIETKTLVDKVVGCFVEHIKSTCDLKKNYLIVGLDLEGALLAARIAMGLKVPFSYIIPVKEHLNSSAKEMEISIVEYDAIILVADAIVAFDTIKKALKELMVNNQLSREQLLEKVAQIYCVFYRESSSPELQEVVELKEKTFCSNMDFSIELVVRDKCPYKKEDVCFALNK